LFPEAPWSPETTETREPTETTEQENGAGTLHPEFLRGLCELFCPLC
jgi:hypothetical protein